LKKYIADDVYLGGRACKGGEGGCSWGAQVGAGDGGGDDQFSE